MKQFLSLLFITFFTTYATDMPSEPFIVSTGNAEINIKPDLANISFRLQITEEESEEAMEKFALRSEDIKVFLAKYQIPGQDITASELNKEAIRNYNKSKLSSSSAHQIAAYRFSRSYTVTLKKLEIYPEFMSDLLKLNNVYSSRSTFNSSKREELEKQLMKDAMSSARNKARTMAEIAGASIKGVYAISDTGLNDLGARFILSQYPHPLHEDFSFNDKAGFARASSASARLKNSIEIPKTLKITAKINAIFSLLN